MAFIRGIISTIFAVLIACFCIFNAEQVAFTWSPFHDSITIPLYLIMLGATLLGFIMGAGIVWFNALIGKRVQKKTIKNLEKELKVTRAVTEAEINKTTESAAQQGF